MHCSQAGGSDTLRRGPGQRHWPGTGGMYGRRHMSAQEGAAGLPRARPRRSRTTREADTERTGGNYPNPRLQLKTSTPFLGRWFSSSTENQPRHPQRTSRGPPPRSGRRHAVPGVHDCSPRQATSSVTAEPRHILEMGLCAECSRTTAGSSSKSNTKRPKSISKHSGSK